MVVLLGISRCWTIVQHDAPAVTCVGLISKCRAGRAIWDPPWLQLKGVNLQANVPSPQSVVMQQLHCLLCKRLVDYLENTYDGYERAATPLETSSEVTA